MTGLLAKMQKIYEDVGFVTYDATNDFHKYKYVSAGNMLNKLQKSLIRHGVIATVTKEEVDFIAEHNMAIVRMVLTFTDVDTGESIHSCGSGSGLDKGDKAVMKASTAAYKYAIAHALCIGWGAEEPEADSSTDEAASSPAKQPWKKQTTKLKIKKVDNNG